MCYTTASPGDPELLEDRVHVFCVCSEHNTGPGSEQAVTKFLVIG